MNQNSTSNERFIVRLPNGWRDALKQEASRERRSMNSEVVIAIQAHLEGKGVDLGAHAQH